jgi:hypothetical protein
MCGIVRSVTTRSNASERRHPVSQIRKDLLDGDEHLPLIIDDQQVLAVRIACDTFRHDNIADQPFILRKIHFERRSLPDNTFHADRAIMSSNDSVNDG